MIVDTTWWSSVDWRHYETLAGVTVPRATELAEATWSTRVVDLALPVPILRANLRKSYRGLIKHAETAYQIEVCDPEQMETFRQLHLREAGRETRPRATWALMAEWVREQKLILIGARLGDEWLGFAGIYRWANWSYYGHAATLRRNLAAALVWHGMLEAKTLGAQYFEVGWQGHATDDKVAAISFFYRGFGGSDWPLNPELS